MDKKSPNNSVDETKPSEPIVSFSDFTYMTSVLANYIKWLLFESSSVGNELHARLGF